MSKEWLCGKIEGWKWSVRLPRRASEEGGGLSGRKMLKKLRKRTRKVACLDVDDVGPAKTREW
jgi:hypothetical protein